MTECSNMPPLAGQEMADRAARTYSGGSKRKLCLAIALIGDADALLLDEPSSGMVRRVPHDMHC